MIKLIGTTITYYFLLLTGFIITSFIIYNKFIRDRLPKEIPLILTERYFWILLYLCCMYLYVIKNLIKPPNKKPDEILKLVIEFIFLPLTTLDHFFKYNKYVKERYTKFMDKFIISLSKCTNLQLSLIIMLFQIIPRIILVFFLLRDVFYFETINIFYKYILLGLIPFLHRYLKYCIYDIKEHYISELESKYECVYMWDLAYNDPSIKWKSTEDNKYHKKELSIKEYVEYEIKILYEKNTVEYDATPFAREDICEQYKKTNNIQHDLNEQDWEVIRREFYYYLSKIKKTNIFYEKYGIINNCLLIRILKIIIFGGYIICWGYFLIINFYTYPLTFKYTIIELIKISNLINEPFSNLSLYEK